MVDRHRGRGRREANGAGRRTWGHRVVPPYNREGRGTVFTLVVRTDDNHSAVVAQIKERLWSLDPRIPIIEALTMDERLAASVARPRFFRLFVDLSTRIRRPVSVRSPIKPGNFDALHARQRDVLSRPPARALLFGRACSAARTLEGLSSFRGHWTALCGGYPRVARRRRSPATSTAESG